MKILFKLATRSRPLKALQAIDNILHHCEDPNFIILVSCDTTDNSMQTFNHPDSRVVVCFEDNKNKIQAINADIHKVVDWDILVATSDDMQFQLKGFDNKIRDAFLKERNIIVGEADQLIYNLDQFIHWDDGYQHGNVCTLSIMGKDYYNRFNYVYHPEYISLWCDAESTEVARKLGKYKYMGDNNIIFRHQHPAWGQSSTDELYHRNQIYWEQDEATFNKRKNINYGL